MAKLGRPKGSEQAIDLQHEIKHIYPTVPEREAQTARNRLNHTLSRLYMAMEQKGYQKVRL